MERVFFPDLISEKSELHVVGSQLLKYWGSKGYMQRSDGFPLLSCPKSLLVVNSTIAPYIDRISPDSKLNVNDVLLQKCIRMNSLENNGLLTSDEWTTSFIMAGTVTAEATLQDVIRDTYAFFVDVEGVEEERLVVIVNPNDFKSIEALKQAKVNERNIRFLDLNKDVWVNWQFGIPGPNGDGITFSLAGDKFKNGPEQFLNIIHIDKYLDTDGMMHDLPSQIIDMGFGLERFVNLKNGVSPFETEIYQKYIELIRTKAKDSNQKTVMRILSIADNARTIKFMIAENIIPDKKAEGYLTRRLARNIFLQLDLLGCFKTNDLYELLFNREERKILDLEVVAYKKIIQRAESIIAKIKPNQFASKEALLHFLKDTHGIPEEISLAFVK